MTRQTLTRRFQQLFISSAVIGAATVVACSSDSDKDVVVYNNTDSDITIIVSGPEEFQNEDEFSSHRIQLRHMLIPGQGREFTVPGDEQSGPWYAKDDNFAAVRLLTNEEEFRFWVKLRAVGQAGCRILVTHELLEVLRENRAETTNLFEDRFTIDDPALLDRDGVTDGSFEDCYNPSSVASPQG